MWIYCLKKEMSKRVGLFKQYCGQIGRRQTIQTDLSNKNKLVWQVGKFSSHLSVFPGLPIQWRHDGCSVWSKGRRCEVFILLMSTWIMNGKVGRFGKSNTLLIFLDNSRLPLKEGQWVSLPWCNHRGTKGQLNTYQLFSCKSAVSPHYGDVINIASLWELPQVLGYCKGWLCTKPFRGKLLLKAVGCCPLFDSGSH